MTGVIDRFEGKFCVIELEGKEFVNVEIGKLPIGAKEGDVVKINNGVIFVDLKETERRKQFIEDKVKDMWE